MIDLTYPEGALSADAESQLPDRLTAALLRHEGAPDNERTRAMTWVHLHPSAAGRINVGGRPAPVPVYRAVVTVPAGTLLHGPGPVGTTARRSLVEEITDILLSAEGTPSTPADRGRVYCLVQEISDGYWGALGTTVRMEDIASIASAELETPLGRQAREAIDALLASRSATARL